MKQSFQSALVCRTLLTLAVLFTLSPSTGGSSELQYQVKVLARVEATRPLDQLGLPIHASLRGADRTNYALVIASVEQLQAAGAVYQVLHRTDQLGAGASYFVAQERVPGTYGTVARRAEVLHDDGRNIIFAATEAAAVRLGGMGVKTSRVKSRPISFRPPSHLSSESPVQATPVVFNPAVDRMMKGVTQNAVQSYGSAITGDIPITVGGVSHQITSRYTYDTDIEIANQFVYEFLQSKGFTPQYHQWYGGRNVVAAKQGTTKPNEIVLVVAHLDSMPAYGYSPGADDNGSGSVGVMLAAELMSPHAFERTVRFVLFTGEEQWMLGSEAYAQELSAAGENVVAVLNLDMIGWDSVGGPVLRLHTRTTASPGQTADRAIAETFVNVVSTYGLSGVLTPMIEADEAPSDHAAFWWVGYPAIMAAEDDYDDFCANYHQPTDTVSSLNLTYWTNYIKAGVGTAAHLASPVAKASPTSR